MRMYQGINAASTTPQQVRSALRKIDQYLRDQSRDASLNQATGNASTLAGEPYLVVALSTNLTAERRLSFSAPLVATDGGAGGSYGVAIQFSNGTYGIGANGNGALDMWYKDTSAAFEVRMLFTSSSALTADRTLTLDVANGSRTLKLTGDVTANQDVSTGGSPTFVGLSTTGNTVIGDAAGDTLRINAGGGAAAPADAVNAARWTSVTSDNGTTYRVALYT